MPTETRRPRIIRKQYLISAKFQMKYVGLILLFMLLTALLCSYVVYYTSMMTMGEKLANVYPQNRLVPIVSTVNFRIVLSLIFVTPFVVFVGIFLSHKIAGPIFRMERFLGKMAEGDLSSDLVLRKGDELQTLASGINNVSISIKTTVTSQKRRLNDILVELSNIKKLLSAKPQDASAISAGISKLETEAQSIMRELDKYTLEPAAEW